jgi:hypothetical protein
VAGEVRRTANDNNGNNGVHGIGLYLVPLLCFFSCAFTFFRIRLPSQYAPFNAALRFFLGILVIPLAHVWDHTMRRTSEKERKIKRREGFVLDLQDDHLLAIGHVAVRSAMLDKLIDLTFEQIIRHYPETTKKEMSKLPSPTRIRVIKDDLVEKMPEDRDGISDFISEIFSARDERNDILHRMWRSTDSLEVKALVEITHDKPELERRRVTPSSMKETANRLLDLAIELGDWKMRSNITQSFRSSASPGRPIPPIGLPPAPRPSGKGR